MDFFETQERYRRREMRGWLVLFMRIVLFGGAIWFGWVWGQAEQSSLQAEADLVIYENNVRITELSSQVQSLQLDLAETKAASMAKLVTGKDNVALRRVIAKKIATGVTSEQIISSIQTLGNPLNCREVERNDVAVATPYGFVGGMTTATILTLVIVPVSYTIFDDFRQFAMRWTGLILRRPTRGVAAAGRPANEDVVDETAV